MKMRCVDATPSLTPGKIYQVNLYDKWRWPVYDIRHSRYVGLTNDDGKYVIVKRSRFVMV